MGGSWHQTFVMYLLRSSFVVQNLTHEETYHTALEDDMTEQGGPSFSREIDRIETVYVMDEQSMNHQ